MPKPEHNIKLSDVGCQKILDIGLEGEGAGTLDEAMNIVMVKTNKYICWSHFGLVYMCGDGAV